MAQKTAVDKRSSKRRDVTPAVGDQVRVPTDVRNDFRPYEHSPGTPGARQPLDGTLIAIREISSGRPVKVAAGDPRGYVFDILDDRTFDPRVAAKANSQGAISGQVRTSAAFHRVQQAIRQRTGRTAPVNGAGALAESPLHGLLDGWRVVRVCTAQIEVTEPED